VLSHTPLAGGFLGVDVFFVISGFLITSLLEEERERNSSISLPYFYTRRALRLLPAVVAVLIFTCVVASIVGSFSALGVTPFRLLSTIGYFANWQRWIEPEARDWFLGHFWSLSIEEQFYLIWPVTLVILNRIDAGRRATVFLVVAGISSSCILKAWLYTNGATAERLFYGSDTRADTLLIGCLLSLMLKWGYLTWLSVQAMRWLARISTFILASLALLGVNGEFLYFGGFTLVGLASGFLVLRSLESPPAILTMRPLLWIGKRAYGLYIWHYPIFLLCGRYIPKPFGAPIAILITFGVVLLSYRYIESPFLRIKRKYRRLHD
jgi:peptidoglycan/LPS O-acetylase OafA/YrhL